MIEQMILRETHGLPKFINLKHAQHRLAAIPGHKPEAVERGQRASGRSGFCQPPKKAECWDAIRDTPLPLPDPLPPEVQIYTRPSQGRAAG
jgi:hypothetical protein